MTARTRLSLGPKQVELLLVAVRTYQADLWPEGEDKPTGWPWTQYQRLEAMAETIHRAYRTSVRRAVQRGDR